MSRYYYDLHIHSCLSPCGSDESTPDSICGMGELNGLDILALTDHNSLKNCPAFFAAAERHGVIPVAGAEVTTAEDIHALCLFETLEGALRFDTLLHGHLAPIKNRPDIFGEQIIMNDRDERTGSEELLLINATDITLDELPGVIEPYGGVCWPAHIDREANGVISVLGAFPEYPRFAFAELYDRSRLDEFSASTGIDKEHFLVSSDAHTLWNIKERTDFLDLRCEGKDAETVRRALFGYLRCGE